MKGRRPAADVRAVALGSLCVATTVAGLVAAKAARDSLFLSHFEVERLPTMMGVSALVSLLAALIAARLFDRLAPGRVLPWAFGASALLHGVEVLLLDRHPRPVSVLLYLHVAVFSATLLTGVWAVVNESFDPHRAKREVSRIALGGPVGGVLGGLAAWQVGTALGVPFGVAVLCVLHALAAPALYLLARSVPATRRRENTEPGKSQTSGLSETAYLRDLGVLVVLVAVVSTLLDYVLSARVAERIEPGPPMLAFFAVFHMVVGIVSFFLQAILARSSLERLGIAGTVCLLPAVSVLLAIAPLASAGLWAAVLLRGGHGFLAGSLYRAGYELFYTPLPKAQKRPAKMIIDVGLDRVGSALGAGVLVSLALIPLPAQRAPIILALVLSALATWQALRLHRGYVAALSASIRGGVLDLSSVDVLDASLRRTLAESQALRRSDLLQAIAAHRTARETSSTSTTDALPDRPSDAPAALDLDFGASEAAFPTGWNAVRWRPDEVDSVLEALAVLRSGNATDIRELLARRTNIEPELVPTLIQLLADNDVAHAVLAALRPRADQHCGQLVDALLDRARDVVVRRRIPRVLEACSGPRAALGLTEALFEDEPDVRLQSVLGLLTLTEKNPELQLSTERVFEAVRQELDRATSAERSTSRGDDATDWDSASGVRVEGGMEFSVLALSLVLEREPLQLAYRAIKSDDPQLRGTALEYFDTVLPDDIKRRGMPFLDVDAPPSVRKRRPSELVEELLKARRV